MVLVLWVIFFRQGRFLLAVISGFVLAQSFNSILHVGYEIIEQALVNGNVQIPEHVPEMTWKCTEFSVMLEHVQAHVAPTDVDPGAGLHWLPKILRSSPKVSARVLYLKECSCLAICTFGTQDPKVVLQT
jgi:hypothetical protein